MYLLEGCQAAGAEDGSQNNVLNHFRSMIIKCGCTQANRPPPFPVGQSQSAEFLASPLPELVKVKVLLLLIY